MPLTERVDLECRCGVLICYSYTKSYICLTGIPDAETRTRRKGIGVEIVMQLEKREPVWMKKGHSSAGGGGTKKAFLSGVMAGHPTPRQTKMGTNCACHPRSGVRRARLYHHLHISCGHSSLNITGEAASNYSELEDSSQGIPVRVWNKSNTYLITMCN